MRFLADLLSVGVHLFFAGVLVFLGFLCLKLAFAR